MSKFISKEWVTEWHIHFRRADGSGRGCVAVDRRDMLAMLTYLRHVCRLRVTVTRVRRVTTRRGPSGEDEPRWSGVGERMFAAMLERFPLARDGEP